MQSCRHSPDLPLRQDLAVTGSVNQFGEVQAIGGVNEKIEGFFDVCVKRRLTRSQGVMIPAANIDHLVLRDDVVAAAKAGRFPIYPIKTIDDGIALLTGVRAGRRSKAGNYPKGSVNFLVEQRLRDFAAAARPGSAGKGNGNGKNGEPNGAAVRSRPKGWQKNDRWIGQQERQNFCPGGGRLRRRAAKPRPVGACR